jgi:hypothetical protein
MNTIQAVHRLRQVIRRQHKALSTESCYVYWLSEYIRAVAEMGHESLETTMGYLHAESLSVRSPLESNAGLVAVHHSIPHASSGDGRDSEQKSARISRL